MNWNEQMAPKLAEAKRLMDEIESLRGDDESPAESEALRTELRGVVDDLARIALRAGRGEPTAA